MHAAGNRAAFSQLLPRLLRGLKRSMTGDLTNHLVVVGLGPAAKSTCSGLQARARDRMPVPPGCLPTVCMPCIPSGGTKVLLVCWASCRRYVSRAARDLHATRRLTAGLPGRQARHAHQCVLSEHWSGPDSQFPQVPARCTLFRTLQASL